MDSIAMLTSKHVASSFTHHWELHGTLQYPMRVLILEALSTLVLRNVLGLVITSHCLSHHCQCDCGGSLASSVSEHHWSA